MARSASDVSLGSVKRTHVSQNSIAASKPPTSWYTDALRKQSPRCISISQTFYYLRQDLAVSVDNGKLDVCNHCK